MMAHISGRGKGKSHPRCEQTSKPAKRPIKRSGKREWQCGCIEHGGVMATDASRARDLEADNTRLQAIVDRLPKTADGVSVLCNSAGTHKLMPSGVKSGSLWHPDFQASAESWGYDFDEGHYFMQWSVLDPGGAVIDRVRHEVCRCYSTREAAEAASEQDER